MTTQNRVHARCPSTRRLLVSGPVAAPATMKWVPMTAELLRLVSYQHCVVSESEAHAYALVVSNHLSDQSAYDD